MRARSADLMVTAVDGQLVMLDLRSANYLRLNRSAYVLWELLQGDPSVEELVATLVDRYEIEAANASEDVATFLGMLRERDLLDEAPATTTSS